MSAIDIFNIRRVINRLPVRGYCEVFHLTFAWRQLNRFLAALGQTVQVTPSVLLPRKDQPVSCRPKDLVPRHNLVKHATRPMFGAEYLAGNTGFRIGHMNGPRLAFSFRAKRKGAARGWDAHVSDMR